jgi:hypothetical protein
MANCSFRCFSLLAAAVGVVFPALLARPARADVSHARIVRLSLVQGDVRFAREAKGDPLADNATIWERAELNLPIRQGYVLATDNGRAEVEFENGAMAFLGENTVLEFFDLSLEDGGRTTRLVLRQGSAEFYVNPARGDYFSVTGGDFSVQADGKATFRLDNFDDGSDVNVAGGRISVLAKNKTTPLEKGQFLSIRAGDEDSIAIDRSPVNDEFDQWVSGRIDSVLTASSAALQYSNSYDYVSGFGDLYTYGAWLPVSGYGYCWRPYGVGLGWSPFDYGNWYNDPFFGWTFLGSQPWGWLPYHYGGWIFQPGFGWVWNPGNVFWGRGPVRWRPVTAVFVRSGGALGVVPLHPMDSSRKTPINLARGVFPVTQRGVASRVAIADGENWKVEKRLARNALPDSLASTGVPARLSRTMVGQPSPSQAVGAGRESTIVYDPAQRRFINANATPRSEAIRAGIAHTVAPVGVSPNAQVNSPGAATSSTRPVSNRLGTNAANQAATPPVRTAPPARVFVAPPSVPRSTTGERTSGGGSGWGGPSSSRGGGSSGGSMPRSSGGGASSGSGGSRPAPAPSGGGRPH